MSTEQVNSSPASVLDVGTVVDDRYRVVALAGQGGMGVVYKAQHVHISRTVALKMLIRAGSDHADFKRFKQEADSASQLRHPNIVTIFDFGPIGEDQFYLAMDYLDGKSIDDEIRENGPLALERVCHIFTQACNALEHAHRNKVVHRDIKNANLVIVDRDGDKDFLVVVDFGLVKLMVPEDQRVTTTGTIVGSPLFMSPEQCRGLALDHRTDIYSLGCAMYEAITGKLPFHGPTVMDTIYLHLKEPAPAMREVNPGIYVPAALEQAVLKSLSKNPLDRQQSMAEFAKDIVRAFSGAPDYVPRVTAGAPKTTSSNVGANQSRVAPPNALTPQEASQVLTNQLLTSTIIIAEPRRQKGLPNWVWRLASVLVILGVIVGSVSLLVTTLSSAVVAHRTHKKMHKPTDNFAGTNEDTTEGTSGDTTSANETENPNSASDEGSQTTATSDKPAETATEAEKTKPETVSDSADTSKQIHQQELLEQDANNAFRSDNWSAAQTSLSECLKSREKLFDPESATLVPFLAKLSVCSYKLNDTGAASHYISRFSRLARQHPDQIVGDAPLLSQVSEAIANAASSSDYQPTVDLLKTAIGGLPEGSEESIGLTLQLARFYTKLGNEQAAEQLLRKCVDSSGSMPELNKCARNWLATLLVQQGRGAEATALER